MMTTAMITDKRRRASRIDELLAMWSGNDNFLMEGECVPFEFDFPPIEEVIDILRNDPESNIKRGGYQGKMDTTDIRESFNSLSIEEALKVQFTLSHFKLPKFYGKGQFLHGFEERVMSPWREFLARAGFEWNRCYPIIFISGIRNGTSYHMDVSHVIAWQIYGTKVFSGLADPEQHSPIAQSVQASYRNQLKKPTLSDDEVVAYTMAPGTVLWNQLLTPHWVDAADEPAMSVNLSHGLLRHRGDLCPNEEALDRWWDDHPDEAWRGKQGASS